MIFGEFEYDEEAVILRLYHKPNASSIAFQIWIDKRTMPTPHGIRNQY